MNWPLGRSAAKYLKIMVFHGAAPYRGKSSVEASDFNDLQSINRTRLTSCIRMIRLLRRESTTTIRGLKLVTDDQSQIICVRGRPIAIALRALKLFFIASPMRFAQVGRSPSPYEH